MNNLTIQEKAELLIRFIGAMANGIVKPNDPTYIIKKMNELQRQGHDIGRSMNFGNGSNDVRDSKDFKPYMDAALDELSEILGLNVVK